MQNHDFPCKRGLSCEAGDTPDPRHLGFAPLHPGLALTYSTFFGDTTLESLQSSVNDVVVLGHQSIRRLIMIL